MSSDDWRDLSPGERALVDRLRQAPPERPRLAARESALRAFLTGEGESLALHPSRVRAQRWTGVAAVAAVLALLLVLGALPRAQWRVTDVVGPEGLGGLASGARVGETLRSGRITTGPESELELQLGDDLILRLVPGSEVELPAGPGRWLGRQRRLRVAAGEVFGTSADRPLGWTLRLAGRDAVGVLTGTTFAAIQREETTCFCLYAGELAVEIRATGETLALPAGQRIWVWPDGRRELAPLDGRETMKLQMSRDRGLQPPPD